MSRVQDFGWWRVTPGLGSPTSSGRMSDGYSTYNGLGLGLPGARRLMDEFEVASERRPRYDDHDDQMATGRMT